MRCHNKIQLLSVLNNHLVAYPTPMNLNWSWNGGSLAGIMLASQMVTGILLAMHYVSHVDYAFASVQHLMTDVPSGMILRYAHANGASLFFIVVYFHILRGMYYNSGAQPRELVWITGVVILLVMIITAFIGYVLPWGQMSFWGALSAPNGLCWYMVMLVLVLVLAWAWCGLLAAYDWSTAYRMGVPDTLLLFASRSNRSKSYANVVHSAFFQPRIQARKRYGPHSWMFVQLVVGMLLSDGHAELHGNGVRISFQQEKSNLDYFLLVNKLLYKLGYVSTMEFEPNYRSNYCDIVGAVRHRIIYRLRTFSFGSLIWLRDLFYADGIKIVRPELEQYLTPLVLAHFICGDGSWAGYGVVLHVNSFTLEHTQLLAHMLSSKFGLVCSVISIRPNGAVESTLFSCNSSTNKIQSAGYPNQYRIYILAESVGLLRELVMQHMPASMHYKLGIGRTTY